jgi:hypothetical protein
MSEKTTKVRMGTRLKTKVSHLKKDIAVMEESTALKEMSLFMENSNLD